MDNNQHFSDGSLNPYGIDWRMFPVDMSSLPAPMLEQVMSVPLDVTDIDRLSLFHPQSSVAVQHPMGLHETSFGNFIPSQLPTGLQVPQQYPFIARSSTGPSSSSGSIRVPSTDIESSNSSQASSAQGPIGTTADDGTYTCTYHGCTLTFETLVLLRKHKEGHHQARVIGVSRRRHGTTVGPGLFNSQAGPHQCKRTHPSTGKTCDKIFSRPYDLTRHEDTIHNARKQNVCCNLCTKILSRADALSRHYRICHKGGTHA